MPTLSSLGKALSTQVNQRTSDCALITLDDRDAPGEARSFQYYPESLSDTKANNYAQKEIFGGSLPLYQWVAGGERLISFTATFTCDVDLLTDPEAYAALKAAGEERRNVDIRAALTWLREHQLPRYDQGNLAASLGAVLTHAPPKVILSLPGTGIGFTGGDPWAVGPDSIVAVMTQCDITLDALFPSGLPRIATVQVAFAQVAQRRGNISFPGRSSSTSSAVEGRSIYTFGYNIRPKGV